MFKKYLGAAATAAVLSVGVDAARADSVGFDFRLAPGSGTHRLPQLTMEHDLVDLTVTAWNNAGSAPLTRSSSGLGVYGVPLGDPAQVDGLLSKESLLFTFAPAARLDRVQFTLVDRSNPYLNWLPGNDNDEVKLIVDNGAFSQVFDLTTQGTGTVDFDFAAVVPDAALRTGMTFRLAATDWNDFWAVGGMRVEVARTTGTETVVTTPPNNPTLAPLPLSAYGGMALLGGMAVVRRIRRRGDNDSSL